MAEGEEDFQDYEWIIGVVIYIMGAVMLNLGNNIVKVGHTQDQLAASGTPHTGYWTSKRLAWAGWGVFTFGGIVNFASFSLAPQSTLSPLAAAQFVSNLFLAWWLNGEKPTTRLTFGTSVVCAGLVTVVAAGPKSSAVDIDLVFLINGYIQLEMILWVSILLVMFVIVEAFRLRLDKVTDSTDVHMFACAPDLSKTLGERCCCCISSPGTMKSVKGLLFAFTSAAIGAHSTLFMKSLSEIARLVLMGGVSLADYKLYLVAGCLGCALGGSISFWIYRLNKSLRDFDALFIVPVMQVFWTVISVVEGAIYFDEFKLLGYTETLLFVCGIGIVFVGVFFISYDGGGSDTPKNAHQYEPIDGDDSADLQFNEEEINKQQQPGLITSQGVVNRAKFARFGVRLTASTAGAWHVKWMQVELENLYDVHSPKGKKRNTAFADEKPAPAKAKGYVVEAGGHRTSGSNAP